MKMIINNLLKVSKNIEESKMQKNILIVPMLIIGLMVVGCSRPYENVTTLGSPEYNGKPVSNIAIFVSVKDIALRKLTEEWFVSRFSKYNMNAVESYKIFPPLRTYTPQEMMSIFKKNNVDSYMVVKFSETSVSTVVYGKWGFLSAGQKKVTYSTDTKLYVLNTANPIWEASYQLKDYTRSDYDDIGYDLACAIVGAYEQDLKQ